MHNLIKAGRYLFAIGIIALGVVTIIVKDFIVGRPPAWPAGYEINPALAYISGVMVILAAMGIIFRRKAGVGALLIAGLILLLSILRHLPHFMNDWLNGYKSIALFGGALIVAVACYEDDNNSGPLFMRNKTLRKNMVVAASVMLAAFFIGSGYAHFKFAGFVNDFIPSYIPFHPFWTYACGCCLLAGGVGLLIPATRRSAAILSGIMVLGWFILLHIPRYAANINDASDRMGLCESFTFSGIFFALAGLVPKKK